MFTECDPDSRHSTSLRASLRLIRRVEAKAASLGIDRNAGMETALEAWTRDVDENVPPPALHLMKNIRHDESERAAATKAERKEVVGVAELLAEVRELREQVSQLAPRSGTGNQFGPPRTAIQDPPAATLKFMSTDPDEHPDVIPYPVPEPAHVAKKGRGRPRS